MSIIERTTKLLLTQFKGSSIKPAILDFYTSDMKKIDDYADGADTRLSALEAEDIALDGRLDTLESWKNDTVDPALSDYATRIGAIETQNGNETLTTTAQTLSSAVNELDADIASLENWKDVTVDPTLSDYNTRISAIEDVIHGVSFDGYYDLVARVDALEAKVDTNATDITTLQENLTRLDVRVTANEAAIGSLNSGLTQLGNRVSILEECCEEVRGILTDHNSRINRNASDIAALDGRLTRAEANISGNASDITILATQNSTQAEQIQDLYDKYNNLDPTAPVNLYSRVATLEGVVGDAPLQTSAQTLTEAVNELYGMSTDVDANEVEYDNTVSGLVATDAQAAIDEVVSAVGVNESAISALESTVGGAGSGLVKDVTDLQTSVGSIESTVGDSNSGLVKDVADLQSTVGDTNAGLVKGVADNASDISALDTRVDALEDGHVYSTSEQVVGKWIDGKPLYERTLVWNVGTVSNTSGLQSLSYTIANLNEIKFIDGLVNRNVSGVKGFATALTEGNNVNQMVNVYYDYRESAFKFNLYSETGAITYVDTVVNITCKYTKTTD